MRNKLIAGYVSLFTGLYLVSELGYITEGLFFQGIALGCFGTDIYEQFKLWKAKRKK